MKTILITKLEELLLKEVGEVAADVRTLQKEYQKLWTSEFENAKQVFIDDGGRAKEFEFPKQTNDIKFESLLEKYSKLKKEADLKIATEQAKNLIIRQEIVSKIKDISQLSDNVGAAVRMLGELQKKWKEVGAVSSHKYKDIQAEYSKAIEDIYYNLKIFRDLQEHDLKKNFELKTEIIEKLRALQQSNKIKETERLIKIYRNEWDEIGPVPAAKWDLIKQNYKEVLDQTYIKIKAHYHSFEEQKENNLKLKQEILEKIKDLISSVEAKANKWNEATEKVISFQSEWKKIGRTKENENEKTWAEFRNLCDSFFEKKKEFFTGLNQNYSNNRKIKSDLISQAEALQNSMDWQKTGLDLIKLQDTWKKHPGNGDKEESKLFFRFRKACNTFFDAKKKHFENIEASYDINLLSKEEMLKQFNEFKLSDDTNKNREQLKAFSTEWNAIGMVPMKDKKRINDAFYTRLDAIYEEMNIDKKEKGIIQFKTKIDRLAASENAFDLLLKESDFLKKLSDEINANIRTYDNNLGFFKTSKGSNSFLKDIIDKIEIEKSKVTELAEKRKLISEQLTIIRNAKDKQKTEK
jgi:hypothetical protein